LTFFLEHWEMYLFTNRIIQFKTVFVFWKTKNNSLDIEFHSFTRFFKLPIWQFFLIILTLKYSKIKIWCNQSYSFHWYHICHIYSGFLYTKMLVKTYVMLANVLSIWIYLSKHIVYTILHVSFGSRFISYMKLYMVWSCIWIFSISKLC
jgi:hypothetical protein